MPGVKELRQLRLKAEATNGTGVSPRFLWRGPVEGIDDQREVSIAEENVGIFGGTDRSYTAKLMAELPIPETEATYEQLPDLFLMCGFGTSGGGNRAGSAQGASGSTVVFTLPIPASTTPITYSCTAEVGDDNPTGANHNAEDLDVRGRRGNEGRGHAVRPERHAHKRDGQLQRRRAGHARNRRRDIKRQRDGVPVSHEYRVLRQQGYTR